MRLLIDRNLSPRLVGLLAELDLDSEPDLEIWQHARDHGYWILTRDGDFGDLSLVLGFPPKILWLRIGNCTTKQAERAPGTNHPEVEAFGMDPTLGVFIL